MRAAVDFQGALRHVFSLPDSERTAGAGGRPRPDLMRMEELLRHLGAPQNRLPAVHVTGTKGKGSTSAMVTSILGQSGYAVGLYTSPHLHTVRERIRMGMIPISEERFIDLVERVWPITEEIKREGQHGRVTTFELLTAMAFLCFAETERDFQVVEVGLGGTLDATNVIATPSVCILTSISLDHTQILGERVEQIARDKAGIIKTNATVVTAPQPPEVMEVIREVCQERGAYLISVEERYKWELSLPQLNGSHFRVTDSSGSKDLWMPLLGAHQVENACCALGAIEALRERGYSVDPHGVEVGFSRVEWPGRLEVLKNSPLVIVDGAHNPYSMQCLAQTIRYQLNSRECILVIGATKGHDFDGIVTAIAALKPKLVVTTKSRHPRAFPASELSEAFTQLGLLTKEAGSVADGMEIALTYAGSEDLIIGTGSLFTVAEVREYMLNIPPEIYPELNETTLSTRPQI